MTKRAPEHGERPKGESADDHPPSNNKKRGVNWEDPSVPIGNAPQLPRWPLVLAGFAWLAWVVFLIVMMLAGNGARAV